MTCLWCDESFLQITWKNLFTSSSDKQLCHLCFEQLEEIDLSNGCQQCCGETELNNDLCLDCINWNAIYHLDRLVIKNISLFKYNDILKEMITQWKYKGDYVLAYAFRRKFQRKFKQHFSQKKNVLIVPIPLSEQRVNERGFNQSAQIASFLTKNLADVLTRTDTEKQAKKSRKERLTQINPFLCNRKIEHPVVLVDDIYTTGATIYAAANKLRENGCPKIYSFTLVRG